MTQKRRQRRRSDATLRIGDMELTKHGAKRFDWHDPYYFAVLLSWPQFLGLVLGAYVSINLAFGALYTAAPGSIANARAGSFLDGFFFSVETLATVGYGVMAPQSLFGHVVSSLEIVVGMGFTAVTTGLLFVRFSKPRSPLLFADQAVVARHNGCPTLMIRLANARLTNLLSARVTLNALVTEFTIEGHRFRRAVDLSLERADSAILPLTWTLMHRLNEMSPLAEYDAARVNEEQVRLFLSIEVYDPIMAASIRDVKVYNERDIAFGWRYADAVLTDAAGHTIADLTRLHLIELDADPADKPVADSNASGEAAEIE